MKEKKIWEEFSDLDQKWSILTMPEKKYNNWQNEDFFEFGKKEINILYKRFKEIRKGLNLDNAIDFGCGIGRNTYFLSKIFKHVDGVDISKKMILEAKRIIKEKNINFIDYHDGNLDFIKDNYYNLVFSVYTLQHQNCRKKIRYYLEEFKRIVDPNGIIYFQLPTKDSYRLVKKLILRTRGIFYFILRNYLRISGVFLYNKLKLAPYMPMQFYSSKEIINFFLNYKVYIFDDNTCETRYLIIKNN